MRKLPFDPALVARMFTKSEYAKAYNLDRKTLDKRIRDGEIIAIPIKGGTVVLANAA